MNGQVVYGKLFAGKENTYVLDDNENRHNIDIQQIDRVVQPGAALVEREHPVALTYPDGAVLRGKIAQVNPESVLLQTAFANEPIKCVFAGASLLRVEDSGSSQNHSKIEDEDRLFHASGNLRGRVLFDVEDGSFIRWKPVGASKAVRLAQVRRAHIERNNRRASKLYPFDTSQFRHILHLKSGEIIPCQISSYDEKSVGFQSPFIRAHLIDSADVKALEFSGRTHANYIDTAHSTNSKGSYTVLGRGGEANINIKIEGVEWIDKAEWVEVDPDDPALKDNIVIHMADGKKVELRPGQNLDEGFVFGGAFAGVPSKNRKLDVKLERALTVPRFNRDTPPNHILVAENGDMKRGKLLGFNGETIRFDSKLRQFSVPIDRVARVVDVSKEAVSNQENGYRSSVNGHQLKRDLLNENLLPTTNNRQPTTDNYSDVCVRLTDGSILIFEPLEVKEDALLGRSPVYGEIRVPIESIQHLYLGDTTASFEDAFAAWVVRPAKEPVFVESP